MCTVSSDIDKKENNTEHHKKVYIFIYFSSPVFLDYAADFLIRVPSL